MVFTPLVCWLGTVSGKQVEEAVEIVEQQIPRGLMPLRTTQIKGLYGAAETAPFQTSWIIGAFGHLLSQISKLTAAAYET
jgi:hypothetical protein